MMNQIRVGRPDDLQTTLSQPQTEIHVIKIDGQVCFIEAANIDKNFLAHEHARGGHHGIVLLEERTVEVPRMPARDAMVSVTGRAAEAEDDAAMLQRAVRIPKPRTD